MSGLRDIIEGDLNRHFSKFDDSLFDDEKDGESKKSIRVKRISTKSFDKHSWKIFENNKIALIIEGESFIKKQITFLLTMAGIQFLIATYKEGNNTLVKIKKALKNHLLNLK